MKRTVNEWVVPFSLIGAWIATAAMSLSMLSGPIFAEPPTLMGPEVRVVTAAGPSDVRWAMVQAAVVAK